MKKRIEVKILAYDELPESIDKGSLSNCGTGKEYANYLTIWHDDKMVDFQSDAMQPEDAKFSRDLNWIAAAILYAYDMGYGDALNSI